MEAREETSQRLETFVAIMIATATVIGAIVAWRASVSDDSAGDADFAGLRAAVRAEETRALNNVNAFESFSSYVNYWRYNEMGNMIQVDLQNAEEEEVDILDRDRANNQDLSVSNQRLFPNKFMDRDGSYNVKRQLGELWADAAKENDLNPDPQFAEADSMRDKTYWLLVGVMVLAISLVFYTLVESFEGNFLRYSMTILGTIAMIAGTAFALFIEFR